MFLCYRGEAEDVLLTLTSAAEKFDIETVIGVPTILLWIHFI